MTAKILVGIIDSQYSPGEEYNLGENMGFENIHLYILRNK